MRKEEHDVSQLTSSSNTAAGAVMYKSKTCHDCSSAKSFQPGRHFLPPQGQLRQASQVASEQLESLYSFASRHERLDTALTDCQ